MLDAKSILVTGGTGSFGEKFVVQALTRFKPSKVIVFSRDEYKQLEMSRKYPSTQYPIHYYLGDIRDKDRLSWAFRDVDYVIHAAALKQVPAAEHNSYEIVNTNVIGTQNVIQAAIEQDVQKIVALSTDKAVNPVSIYGISKLAMEKLVTAAGFSSDSAGSSTQRAYCVARCGNMIGSRGSVVPYFKKLIDQGFSELPVTNSDMTRFWITLEDTVQHVYHALSVARGGEIFVPKSPSMKVSDLVKALSVHCTMKVTGARRGEKLHELLISHLEAGRTLDCGNHYKILAENDSAVDVTGQRVAHDFEYSSDKNSDWLPTAKMAEIIGALNP